MTPDSDALRYLTDRQAIEDLLVRYAWATDTWDTDLSLSCFTDDAEFRSHDGTVLASGRSELKAFVSRGRSGGRLQTMAGSELVCITHPISNVAVEFRGDEATVWSASVSYSLAAHGDGDRVFAHGLRYNDEVCRDGDAWLFTRRTHHLDWQFEVPANTLTGPS